MTIIRRSRPLSTTPQETPDLSSSSKTTAEKKVQVETRKPSDPRMPGQPNRPNFHGTTSNYTAPPKLKGKLFPNHLTRIGISPPDTASGSVMPLKDAQECLESVMPPGDQNTLTSALAHLESQHEDKFKAIPEAAKDPKLARQLAAAQTRLGPLPSEDSKVIPQSRKKPNLERRLAMLRQLEGDAPVYGWTNEGGSSATRQRVALDHKQKTTLRCAITAALIADIPLLKKRSLQKEALAAATKLWNEHEAKTSKLPLQERSLLGDSLEVIGRGKPSRMKREAGDIGRLFLGQQPLSPARAAGQSGDMLGKIRLDDNEHLLLTTTLKELGARHQSTTVMHNHLAVIRDLEADSASEGSLLTPVQRGQARCAVVAAALKALPTRSGEVQEQAEVIDAVSRLWDDFSQGKLMLGPEEKLLVTEQLAGTFMAKTPFTAEAVKLRSFFLDRETHRLARDQMQPIAAFPDPGQILDLGEVELEGRSEASQQQTRPAVMAELDEIDYRDKDIKYGNSRAATEVLDGALTSMAGMDAPDAKLALNGAHLFNPSAESRRDHADHADHPERFATVASPLTLEYQDVGDLARDPKVMRETIREARGDGAVEKYDLAIASLATTEAAEKVLLKAQEKTGHAQKQTEFDTEQEGLAGEKESAIELLDTLKRAMEAPGASGDTATQTRLRAVEATLRDIHTREADLNEREDAHWEPNREARMAKYNAMMRMVDLFPAHMKEEIQKLHMVSLLNHNFDPYNWGLANAGFSTIGEMIKWRISVVDHGNSVMDGFGGMQKVNSWLRGNTRARKDDPLMPNFVFENEVRPRFVPASITGISSFQRAMPFARLLKDLIGGETRIADNVPVDQLMMKYEKELEPAIEMAYRFSLMPKEAYERVAENKWPGGADGKGSDLFPWRPGDVHRSHLEVSEILFDRKQAIIDHFPPEIIEAWQAKYPEKTKAAYNEVAAGIAGTTGYYIDHPDSRPSSVRSAMI
jgi:hypothetical protein